MACRFPGDSQAILVGVLSGEEGLVGVALPAMAGVVDRQVPA